jgi:hypothetical protein
MAVQVPVACATYLDDMYVDYNLAQETLEGAPAVRQWVTNEFKHRWDSEAIGQRSLAGAVLQWMGPLSLLLPTRCLDPSCRFKVAQLSNGSWINSSCDAIKTS